MEGHTHTHPEDLVRCESCNPRPTYSEFLAARIAEDEAVVRSGWSRGVLDPDASNLEKRWQHARVLAECEAKRRIVDFHPSYGGYGEHCATCVTEDELTGDEWPCATLRFLALPYADHPDYRPEWRA